MSRILAIVIKDMRLLTRDRMGLFFIAVLPVGMGLFFGMVMGDVGSGSSGSGIPVAVVDEDQSDMSALFVKSLEDAATCRLSLSRATRLASRCGAANRRA